MNQHNQNNCSINHGFPEKQLHLTDTQRNLQGPIENSLNVTYASWTVLQVFVRFGIHDVKTLLMLNYNRMFDILQRVTMVMPWIYISKYKQEMPHRFSMSSLKWLKFHRYMMEWHSGIVLVSANWKNGFTHPDAGPLVSSARL